MKIIFKQMDLPVRIESTMRYSARLPHVFLNYLLAEGFQFETMLCLKQSTVL
jgi:hypothetical protein